MNDRRGAYGRCGMSLLLGWAIVFLAAAPAAGEDVRPRIAVAFSSQAQVFADVETQVVAGVEEGLGELADRLEDRFGFLDWGR